MCTEFPDTHQGRRRQHPKRYGSQFHTVGKNLLVVWTGPALRLIHAHSKQQGSPKGAALNHFVTSLSSSHLSGSLPKMKDREPSENNAG